MNIALIAPSPIPFMVGGAEKLLTGLHFFADKMSSHRVELIKVPIREHSFWDIIEAYHTFYNMNLSHFDAVISQKYPAWMLRHPRHMVYMLHRLRGLNDAYPPHLPLHVDTGGNMALENVLRYIETQPAFVPEIDELFSLLRQLRANAYGLNPGLFSLPGPLIRRLVRFMDDWALHPSRIKRYAAISDTVKNRPGYFPEDAIVETIYPASALEGLTASPLGDYLFTASRLDYAKRLDLIIKAFRKSRAKHRLLIAGTGPAEQELKALASGDPRIEFVGYVSNDALVDYYKGCYGVVYVPVEEDYGYITIEAMQCAKPVITCSDSGGTLEFVQDGKTGLIAKPNAVSLAKAIDRLCSDAAVAEAMGTRAQERVKNITWSDNMNQLFQFRDASPKIKALALSTYEVFTCQHGGQLRVYNIHKNLANAFDSTLLCIGSSRPRAHEKCDMREIVVNPSPKQYEEILRIASSYPISIMDIAMAELLQYSPHILDTFTAEYAKADVIFLEQPYLAPLLPPNNTKPVIYNSQNVEYLLKKAMLDGKSESLLTKVKDIEQLACDKATIILACSEEDIQNFIELYGVDPEKFLLLPNGFDCAAITPAYAKDRMKIKAALNIPGERIAVFIGSSHKPNVEAVEHILSFAKEMPDVSFIVMGTAGNAFGERRNLPTNVAMTGLVEDTIRDAVFRVADVAINPMDSGGGTNLKLAEYICHGLPVVTTATGARGYGIVDGETAILSELSDFPPNIRKVLAGGDAIAAMERAAGEYIRANFDWSVMVERSMPALLAKLGKLQSY